MSSAVVSTSAALGRPFVFDEERDPEAHSLATCTHGGQAALDSTLPTRNQPSKIPPAGVTPASRLSIRPMPEMTPSGIPPLDALTGGLPRGCVTEICGPASSGRTSILMAALAAATCRGEFCVVVDANDSFDPHSAAAAGIELDRLLWVRCGDSASQKKNPPPRHGDTEENFIPANRSLEDRMGSGNTKQSEHRLEQVLRVTDLLLESGGFGLIVLDLADLPPQTARLIPLTTWFRFRRAIEHTPTMLVAIEQQPIAGSCSSLVLQLRPVPSTQYPAPSSREAGADALRIAAKNRSPSHAQLFTELQINADLICSRLQRKPASSATFATKTAWVG